MQSDSALFQTDLHTLAAYITHLTSTGKPQAITDLVFKIFPELNIPARPFRSNFSAEERKALRKQSRDACLRRAAQLGPYFFAALINALSKAGQTGLAERVWMLAKQAERASWKVGFVEGVQPWLLSVHAYTSMIQCYVSEANRSQHRMDGGGRTWQTKPKLWVHGWARTLYTWQHIQSNRMSRRIAGRQMGMLVLRSMLNAGRQVVESFVELRQAETRSKETTPPLPDARFFNAVMQLFRLDVRVFRKKRSPASYRKHFKWTMRTFARSGVKTSRWTPLLQAAGEAIVRAGYPIPLGYRHLFVGHWPEGTRDVDPLPAHCRTPFAYPRQHRTAASVYNLPITKTRGLPIRNKPRRRIRLRQVP